MGNHIGIDFAKEHGAELQEFLYEALLRGYGSESNSTDAESADGSTKLPPYECGDWKYVDEYYGGEPYSGITVIYYKGVACFSMVYWGKVLSGVDRQSVYDCLMPALMATNPAHPWRGPNQFVAANGLRYTNLWHGSIEKFYGQEKIGNTDDDWLYEADYRGGIINLR
jgi:hypothetical protein